MFKGCHFPKSIILTSVRWYLRYKLSYRDIEELMAERGVRVDHATINRWVVKFSPLPTAGSPKGLTITPHTRTSSENAAWMPYPRDWLPGIEPADLDRFREALRSLQA